MLQIVGSRVHRRTDGRAPIRSARRAAPEARCRRRARSRGESACRPRCAPAASLPRPSPASLADLGHLLFAAPRRGKGGRFRLDDVAKFLHRLQEDVPVGRSRVPGEHIAIEQVPALARLDPAADLGARGQKAFRHQHLDRLAHRRAADVEGLATISLRWAGWCPADSRRARSASPISLASEACTLVPRHAGRVGPTNAPPGARPHAALSALSLIRLSVPHAVHKVRISKAVKRGRSLAAKPASVHRSAACRLGPCQACLTYLRQVCSGRKPSMSRALRLESSVSYSPSFRLHRHARDRSASAVRRSAGRTRCRHWRR